MAPKKSAPKEKKRRIPKGTAGPGGDLREAAKEGDLSSVRSLAVAHMIDDTDERGFTALLWAAWNGHYAVVDVLLKRRADIEHTDEDGQTALFHAAWYGHHLVVSLLLEEGADPNKADNEGEAPLSAAARSGSYEAVVALIRKNADPQARDSEGHNAVSRALRKGHQSIAQVIENYARVYTPAGQGAAVDTILELAGQNHMQFETQKEQLTYYERVQDREGQMPQHMPQPAGQRFYPQTQHTPPQPQYQQHQQRDPRSVDTFQEAVAPLDGLNRQLQARLTTGGGGGGGGGGMPEKGSYSTLTVLAADTVRIMGRGQLPPVGSAVMLQGTQGVVWSVVSNVKGGGVRLQAGGGNRAGLTWGDPGDEAGAGMWAVAVGERAQMGRAPEGYASPSPGVRGGSPVGASASAALAQQQYQHYQRNHQHLQQRAPPPPQGLNTNQVAFGSAGAKEASMPLEGVPPAGSPRRSKYKRDSPAYRGVNACTICGKKKPPLNFCEECNEEMCGSCWVREHQNKKRRFHVPHPVCNVKPFCLLHKLFRKQNKTPKNRSSSNEKAATKKMTTDETTSPLGVHIQFNHITHLHPFKTSLFSLSCFSTMFPPSPPQHPLQKRHL